MKKAVLLINKANTYNFIKKDLNQYDLHRVHSWWKQGYQRQLSRNLLNSCFNLKMSFFPENVWMTTFLEPIYLFFLIIVLLFVPKYGYIEIYAPDSQLPRPLYTFTKNRYFWSKSQTCIKKKSYFFMKQRKRKAGIAKTIVICENNYSR